MTHPLVESLKSKLLAIISYGQPWISGGDIPLEADALELHFFPGRWDATQLIHLTQFTHYLGLKYPYAIVVTDAEAHQVLATFIILSEPVHEKYQLFPGERNHVWGHLIEYPSLAPEDARPLHAALSQDPVSAFDQLRELIARDRQVHVERALFIDVKYLEVVRDLGPASLNQNVFSVFDRGGEVLQELGLRAFLPKMVQKDFRNRSKDMLEFTDEYLGEFKGGFFFQFLHAVLEGSVSNLVVLAESTVLLAAKTVSENATTRVLPIPASFFNGLDLSGQEPLEAARAIHAKTRNETIVVPYTAFHALKGAFSDKDQTPLVPRLFKALVEFVQACVVYPEPLHKGVFSSFGIDFDTFVQNLLPFFRALYRPFKHILQLVVNPVDSTVPVLSVMDVTLDGNGNITRIKHLPRERYFADYRDAALNEGLRSLKQRLETTSRTYDLYLALDWKYVTELLSLQNYTALSKMRNFFMHIPFVGQISRLISKTKAAKQLQLDEALLSRTLEVVQEHADLEKVPILSILPLVNQFFLEGIAIIEPEEHEFDIQSDPTYRARGYLGWSLKSLLEFFTQMLASNSP